MTISGMELFGKRTMENQTTNRAQSMGEQNTFRLLLRFSVPAVVGMMVQALYNFVDRIYIGRAVGSVGIAATTVSMPIMMLGFAFALMIGIGATALISIRLGEQSRDQAEQVMGNASVMLFLTSIALMALGLLFLTPALRVFGATDTILPYAQDYMRIILLGWLFQTFGFGLNNFIRGEGNPKMAMLTMLIGAIANMILDPIFIFGFGWGMKGAAWATVISQMISAVWVLYYFLSGKSVLKIRMKYFRLEPSLVLRILALGGAPFLMHVSDSMMSAIVNNQLRTYGGDLGISMLGVIMSLMMMIFMFIIGMSQGAQPIIGYNYGAKEYKRVKKTLVQAIMVVTGGVLIGYVIIMLFPAQLVRMFAKDDEALVELGVHAIPIFMSLLPLVGFQALSSSFFQAVGKAKISMFLVLTRSVILSVPCILILPRFFGLDGIWVATPISTLGSSLITGTFLYVILKQLREE
jgi:putative MATE family efflux protein